MYYQLREKKLLSTSLRRSDICCETSLFSPHASHMRKKFIIVIIVSALNKLEAETSPVKLENVR